jgi:hypothetical protein
MDSRLSPWLSKGDGRAPRPFVDGAPGRAPPGRSPYHRRVGDLAIVLVVILVLVLIWRGPKTLPRLGEALGRGVREARHQATRDDDAGSDTTPDPMNPAARDGDRRS